MEKIFNIITLFICFLLLIVLISGIWGNPTSVELIDMRWVSDGPFELFPERGRFALAYSLIEDKSVHFSIPLARFAVPDLGYRNGHYVSLFFPSLPFTDKI